MNTHVSADEFNRIEAKEGYTSAGQTSLSPWTEENQKYVIGQINLGSNFIKNFEIVSALNLNNVSIYSFNFSTITGPNKWNPKLYLSILNTVAISWNMDNDNYLNKKEIPWPESYQFANTTALLIRLRFTSITL